MDKFLDEETVFRYQNQMADALEPLTECNMNIPSHWDNLKTVINKTATETIGVKTTRYVEWYDDECRQVNTTKNIAWKKYIEKSTRQQYNDYKEKRKIAKKVLKKKKKEYLKDQIAQIEKAADHNRSRDMYHLIKKQTRGYEPQLKMCRSKDGRPICDEQQIMTRWNEFYKDMLNRENPNTSTWNDTLVGAENRIDSVTISEVSTAIKKLKNNKSSGEDNIVSELLKYGGPELHREIHKLITNIWNQEEIPAEWLSSVIIPIHKKGDKTICGNYRGISLLSTTYKVFSNVLYERIYPYYEEIVEDYQGGFRKEKSVTDQCFILGQIFEKFHEFSLSLHCLFIDFKQAFDSIDRQTIKFILLKQGIPNKLVSLIMMTLNGTIAKVRIHGQFTDSFNVRSGVKQGDALSTAIFNLVLHSIITEVNRGGTIMNKSIQICAYADDVLIIARSIDVLKETFIKIEKLSEKVGLFINQDKTKYMYTSASRRSHDLNIGEYIFESVDSFRYLGVRFDKFKDSEEAVMDRIQAANRAYFANLKLFRSRLLSRTVKLRLYKTIIRPVLTFGCELWTLKENTIRQLQVFERKMLRKIYGPLQLDGGEYRIRFNCELEELIGGLNVVRFVKSQRIRWLGHVLRMPETRTLRKIFDTLPEGKRRRGRPRRRWLDAVEEDLQVMGVSGYRAAARDRDLWRGICLDALAHTEL